MILFGMVLESFHRRPFSVVAAVVPLAQQMAKSTRPLTVEASNYAGESSKSEPDGKAVLVLAAVRHQQISPLISAQEKTRSDVKGQEHPCQASGDRLPSKGDDDVTDLLSPGVELLPNWVTRVEENLKNTLGTSNLTKLTS